MRGSGRFRKERTNGRHGGEGFNPLHCGAVVASDSKKSHVPGRELVSIPFIAGQWSLRTPSPPKGGRAVWFQSPSLRGSGRFGPRAGEGRAALGGFNPLHCGAVVASRRPRRGAMQRGRGFNPLHCGAVVASGKEEVMEMIKLVVSIPFIAGQWSLPHDDLAAAPPPGFGFQSPSLRGSGRFPPAAGGRGFGATSFNPLHCGAVVASMTVRWSTRSGAGVSIPFIAGQWSLRAVLRHARANLRQFQSPSLRGSGRFPPPRHCVAGGPRVSIPFIAGQWSLLPRTTPLSFCGVLLRKRRLPCDHIICTRLPF